MSSDPLENTSQRRVRMVDPMGHKVEEPSEQNESENTVIEVRYSHQEVADLQRGRRGVDTRVLVPRLPVLRIMLDATATG